MVDNGFILNSTSYFDNFSTETNSDNRKLELVSATDDSNIQKFNQYRTYLSAKQNGDMLRMGRIHLMQKALDIQEKGELRVYESKWSNQERRLIKNRDGTFRRLAEKESDIKEGNEDKKKETDDKEDDRIRRLKQTYPVSYQSRISGDLIDINDISSKKDYHQYRYLGLALNKEASGSIDNVLKRNIIKLSSTKQGIIGNVNYAEVPKFMKRKLSSIKKGLKALALAEDVKPISKRELKIAEKKLKALAKTEDVKNVANSQKIKNDAKHVDNEESVNVSPDGLVIQKTNKIDMSESHNLDETQNTVVVKQVNSKIIAQVQSSGPIIKHPTSGRLLEEILEKVQILPKFQEVLFNFEYNPKASFVMYDRNSQDNSNDRTGLKAFRVSEFGVKNLSPKLRLEQAIQNGEMEFATKMISLENSGNIISYGLFNMIFMMIGFGV